MNWNERQPKAPTQWKLNPKRKRPKKFSYFTHRSNKEPSVKGSLENDAAWLSSMSTEDQIRCNGGNGSEIKSIFLVVINTRMLLNIGRDDQ